MVISKLFVWILSAKKIVYISANECSDIFNFRKLRIFSESYEFLRIMLKITVFHRLMLTFKPFLVKKFRPIKKKKILFSDWMKTNCESLLILFWLVEIFNIKHWVLFDVSINWRKTVWYLGIGLMEIDTNFF